MASLWKEASFKTGYGHIAAKVWGDAVHAAQRFLAVHGWLDNAGTFDPLMERFMKTGWYRCPSFLYQSLLLAVTIRVIVIDNRCVVCLDLPGHGLSSHHPKGIPYSPPSDIQAMRTVAKDLGWEKYSLLGK